MYKADRLRVHAQSLRLRELIDIADSHLPFSSDTRVLDIGSGDGYATSRVLENRPRSLCLGVDLSMAKLKTMRARTGRCFALLADAECVPLKSNSFDIIFCFELLEHVIDQLSVLKEIRRLLRPQGRCLISTPADSFIQPAAIKALSMLKHWRSRRKEFNEHLHFGSIVRLRRLFSEARLQIVIQRLAGFQYPFRSLVAEKVQHDRLIALEQRLSERFRFGSIGAGPLTFGNEYLIFCARPS